MSLFFVGVKKQKGSGLSGRPGHDMGMGTARDRAWFVMWLRGTAVHRGPAPQRPSAAEARRHKGPRSRPPADATPWAWANIGKEARGFGLPWAKATWVWATMGKKTLGFGLPWAKKHLGLGYHGQKTTWAWPTMSKVSLGLGYYGHRTPVGLGYRGQKLLGFGLPWAKITSSVWATMGKIYLGLGYYGHRTPAGSSYRDCEAVLLDFL